MEITITALNGHGWDETIDDECIDEAIQDIINEHGDILSISDDNGNNIYHS